MAYLCPHPCDGKTEYGYCRYTWCINPLHSNLGTAYQGQGVQMAIITNADKLRSMTDEELAMAMPFPQCPPHKGECTFSTMIANSCDQCWLDWLRQEVKEAGR